MATDLINQALQNIQQSYNNMQNLYNNQPNPQSKSQEYLTNMNKATETLEKKTGYNEILNQYLNSLNTYTQEYSKMPLLGTLKKQYLNKTPTEDLDQLTEKMMQMRDTIEAKLGKLQSEQGIAVNPAKMYNLSNRLKAFYDSQIQKLQKEKENRIKSAELQAEIDYQDRIQRLRQLDSSLNNLKSMLNIARQQVKEGKMDVRNALKLQQEYDKTNATLKKELVDAQNKLGMNMLSIRQAVKGMELKEKQTEASTAYTQALTNQIQNKLQEQELGDIKKAYNLKTTQVVGKDKDTNLPIFEPVIQGGKRYFDVTGKIDDGKHITVIANNPGSITYNGTNGKFLQSLGAIGIVKSPNGRQYAVFPDEETGKKAIEKLLNTNIYKNLTLSEAMKKRTGEENPVHIKIIDKNLLNKKISDLTNNERQKVIDKIIKAETGGYKPETYNPLQRETTQKTDLDPSEIYNTVLYKLAEENKKGTLNYDSYKTILNNTDRLLLDEPENKKFSVKYQILKDTIPAIANQIPDDKVRELVGLKDGEGNYIFKDILDDVVDYPWWFGDIEFKPENKQKIFSRIVNSLDTTDTNSKRILSIIRNILSQ